MKKRKEVTFVRKLKDKCLVAFMRGPSDPHGNRVDELQFENEETSETWVEKHFRSPCGLSILMGGDDVFN
jgi:hypothetical protein